MSFERRLGDAIAAIYDAVDRPETWGHALGRVSDLMGAVGSHVMFWSSGDNAVTFSTASDRLDEQASIDYARDFAAIDPNRVRAERLAPGTIYCCTDHFDEAFARRSAYHNDFLSRYGLRYIAGSRVLASDDFSAYFCLNRNREQGAFVGADVAVIARLLPHFQRAARMHYRLTTAEAMGGSMTEVLDRLPFAAFLVDGKGRSLHHNRAADAILTARDGLSLIGDRLCTALVKETQQVQQAIHQTVMTAARRGDTGSGAMRVTRPSGRPSYVVQFMPLSPDSRIGGLRPDPLALAVVIDPAHPDRRPSGRNLSLLFGLTATESQLALALLQGRRLEEIADERGVKITTLRTQLSAILAKTGTQRQTELLLLLARLPS